MKGSILVRIFILASLFFAACAQICIISSKKTVPAMKFSPDPLEEVDNEFPFDLYFPLINKTADEKDVMNAEKYLHLPTWSAGYLDCNNELSEVSCFEIVRAHKAIQTYENTAKSRRVTGKIYINAEPYPLADRMSMLYHAFLISMVTNRVVYVKKSLYPFKLPDYIKDSGDNIQGIELPSDYQFGCIDISNKYPDLLINNITWPQVLYTHYKVAPFLRNNFGFHAAYYVGNYLFGTSEPPKDECKSTNDNVLEAHNFNDGIEFIPPVGISKSLLERCDVKPEISVVTNDPNARFGEGFSDVTYVTDEDEAFVCGLRKIISAQRVVHTFGSRYGWWAAAMQGRKGGYINTLDRICVKVANSQAASLWHTYCPVEKNTIMRTNNRMFVCGPNANDARLYVEYLLW
ncbi:hypothetical protein TVAG_434350 [Trichomonas vaginalis G3]|uniref:Uncharacterized protein n=1 Tax=Trichomonas vaginalis (strain ATCC PRA-98 / G3) TaxID=412133 RepID=A2DSL8_TRIV3|nr:hypothetical protein TVAGG3_0376410 [Trichomonas vaginalis G3]EAY16598.1 hypothetical protein TVAG_434350 [Trichomonas vaginalis G3]KAI5532976.1 hypothetical protein TVAGG3_0376410 [Trichomonas vaginalis G3]|eukprot:XP_001328821.1 hypothetical protein [Trichomonas vaginalis G3]